MTQAFKLSCAIALATLTFAWPEVADAAETRMASVTTAGEPADDDDFSAVISGNGRFVTWESQSTNLVPGLDGFTHHVFVHDLVTGTTIAVDWGPDGLSNDDSNEPSISRDGSLVAFNSRATNLIDLGPFGGTNHILVRNIHTGEITLASVNENGNPSGSENTEADISATGQFVAFTTFENLTADDDGLWEDVYVRDMLGETTERVSVTSAGVSGDGDSGRASISADGRYVAFTSEAGNLDPDDTNDLEDIFLRDRVAGTTTRITEGPGGADPNGVQFVRSGPVVSGNGQLVVFASDADNLVANDTNDAADIFVYDIAGGTIERVNLTSAGAQTNDFADSENPSISENGRFVAFESISGNLGGGGDQNIGGIYLRDRNTGATHTILFDDFGSQKATVSNNGQRVAFESFSALVPNDTNERLDIFVHDRQTVQPSDVSLVASVLPTSRSVQVGSTASAFATIINTGTELATDCALELPIGTSIPFNYQTTDAATNAPTGSPNTPADIAAGASQSFIFSLAPTVALDPIEIAMVFICADAFVAPSISGVNTLLFSASDQPVGDVIALSSTLGAIPGVVDIDGVSGAGAFAMATSNVGAADTFRVVPRATAGVPVALSICETNPIDGTCLQSAAAEVQTMIAANGTPTFAIFVGGTGQEIVLDPATRRIAVEFFDSGDEVRGGTSVAIRTN